MLRNERDRGLGRDKIERRFYSCVKELGLPIIHEPAGLEAPYCVENKWGEKRKVKTNPDYYITHPDFGLSTYVEVTRGAGTSPSKIAQRRVIEAAHIENYVLLTGDHVQALVGETDLFVRRALLFEYLGWASVTMQGTLTH